MINEQIVNELIEQYKLELEQLKEKKSSVVSENAATINEVIRKKVEAISEQLKEEAILEVCKDAFDAIEKQTELTETKLNVLLSIIEKPVEETEEQITEA